VAFSDIIDGRKSLVSTRSNTRVAPEVLALVRAFAAQHRLYHGEAVSYLITMSLSQHEGWAIDEEEALKYLPKPLLKNTRKQLHSGEKATILTVEDILSWGCPPEEVIVSAEMNQNLYEWYNNWGLVNAMMRHKPGLSLWE